MPDTVLVDASSVSLFHLAAKYLGNATQWYRIAQLNGLSGPDLTWLPSPVPLTIPATDSTLTDGLPETSA